MRIYIRVGGPGMFGKEWGINTRQLGGVKAEQAFTELYLSMRKPGESRAQLHAAKYFRVPFLIAVGP